jgi:hypothetical protein
VTRLPSLALLAAALALPAPAAAQGQIGPPARPPARQAPEPPPVAFSYSSRDSGLVQQGLVGTLPLSPGLSAVTDDSRRSPETRRNWTPMEVGRRTERVAAVGLKLRF